MDLTRNGNPVLGNSLTKKVGLTGKVSERWKKKVSSQHSSSGGFRCRNWFSSSRSYAIFSAPQITSGQASKPAANNAPASVGLAAAATLRGTDVTLAAAGRSGGVTTAITYEERVGTSICDRADLMRRSASAISTLGVTAARTKHTLEGMCVNTIVLMRPTRSEEDASTRSLRPKMATSWSRQANKVRNPAL